MTNLTNFLTRPTNWADDVVAEMISAYAEGGHALAEAKWHEIVERDTPLQIDANVALGRYREITT